MNRDELNDLMAGYLAGELDHDARRRFQQHLRADSSLAREVAELQRALQAVRAIDDPGTVYGTHSRSQARSRPFRAFGLLRYAAIILLGFGAGYAAKSISPREMNQPSLSQPQKEADPSAPRIEQLFAEAYVRSSADSELARSLIALSRATR